MDGVDGLHRKQDWIDSGDQKCSFSTDKGLICKIYKWHIQLNTRKTSNPIKKWEKDINRYFSKKDIQMVNKHEKMLSIAH